MKAEVVWSKRLRNFIDVVFNVNKSQCQAQILTLMSIPDCNFSIYRRLFYYVFYYSYFLVEGGGKIRHADLPLGLT